MKLPFKRIKIELITYLFTGAIFILIVLYGVTYKQIKSGLHTSDMIMHGSSVELELERLISHLRYAETAQRGFLITGDSAFLIHFQKSWLLIRGSFNTLNKLLKNDIVQLRYLDVLELTVEDRYRLLQENMKQAKGQVIVSRDLAQKLEVGAKLMESSMKTMESMLRFQDFRLKELQDKHIKSIINTPIIYLIIVLISLFIFIALLLRINSDRRKLKKINEEIILTNHSYSQAESLAGLSNWRFNSQTRITTFSDNFYSLLGIRPEEREITMKYFLLRIHKDDRMEAIKVLRRAFNHCESFSYSYRLNSADGKIKYVKSIGKLIADDTEQRYLIGVNMDVTELVINARKLETKNKKLELFNADLASFNYVASHDLQAPLRKIQMFISRIRETDLSTMSTEGKEYFERIHASAGHMQVLINDLLMFSRTNATNKRFELTNLNHILDNASDELNDLIEEKEAVIKAVSLPKIYAIPYQIQQLFINLILNSLKFAKENEKPVINISCAVIDSNKVPVPSGDELESDRFYKIVFSDNGIGFDNKYSHRIFHLLFRLHEKRIYPGSGIGLAICKKIVENHFGYIEANSQPGIGTDIIIYLPVNLSKVRKP